MLRPIADVAAVSTARDAARYLNEYGELPLIFDLEFADGLGLDVLRRARSLDPTIEALLVGNAALQSTAEKHNVRFARTPLSTETVAAFVEEVDANDHVRRNRILRALEMWSANNKLTHTERTLLYAMAVEGIPRKRLAGALGKSEETVKAHVRNVIKKTCRPTIAQVVVALLRAALR